MKRQPIYLLATGTLPERLVEEAAGRGVVLDAVEFIRTEFREEMAEMEKLVAQSLAVVFTSVNAVNAVRRWLKGSLPDWRIYCISGATCGAVVSLFGEKAVAGKAGSAAGLAEVIPDREIVFFCGDQRREELPAFLRQAGSSVVEEVVYRTVLTPHKVERRYDGIAFFSPSAVESFFSINAVGMETALFAIGPTTATAIGAWCTNRVITGGEPDKERLVRLMTEHFLQK
jgi:uroporphyrinogen-III synthase